MKNFKSCLTLFLLITLIISCSSDDDDTSPALYIDNGITVTNITLSKQTVFVNEIINFDFESEGHESITIAAEESDIAITTLSETSYEITSSTAVSGFIDVTLSRFTATDTIIELQQVEVNFIDHGANLANSTVEGIQVGDNTSQILIIHGEPEGIRISDSGFTETWYYFSKGISYTIDTTVDVTALKEVISIRLFGLDWGIEIDGTIQNGVAYPYDISNLGNFTDPEGLLMDSVIVEYDLPAEEYKLSGGTSQTYGYSTNTTETFFSFISDDIEDYVGKNVSSIYLF